MVEAQNSEPVVLVVDDDPEIVGAIRRALFGAGYRLLTTTDPYQAVALLAEEPIDVVLSDLSMPGLEGYEVMNRARRVRPEAVRCLVTGVHELEAATRAINECEVYRFVSKPFDGRALREMVVEALARKKELARLMQAERQVTVRRALIDRVEAACPGLTRAELDEDHTYHLDPERMRRCADALNLGALLGR